MIFFITLARNKDSEDNKKDLGDGKEQLKTALGRRASGVTTKLSKPGEQVCSGQQSRSSCMKLSWVLLPIFLVAPHATGSLSEIGIMLDIILPVISFSARRFISRLFVFSRHPLHTVISTLIGVEILLADCHSFLFMFVCIASLCRNFEPGFVKLTILWNSLLLK